MDTYHKPLPMNIVQYPSMYIIGATILIIIGVFIFRKKIKKQINFENFERHISISEPRLLSPEEVRIHVPRFSEFFRADSDTEDELEDDVFEDIPLHPLTQMNAKRRGTKEDSLTESTDDIIFDNSMAVGTSGLN